MNDPARTTLTLANARGINLRAPSVDDIDFDVIGEHLAKANRYCGATPGRTYSVAEHSVRGADLILDVVGDRRLAAYFLCHDMHEAFLGDDTTPKKRALEEITQSFGVLAGEIERAFAQLTDGIDWAIHAKAGLPWPAPPDYRNAVKHWDRVMLATEWRDLMQSPPPFDFGVEPHVARIEPLQNWTAAANLFKSAVAHLLPARI